MPILYKSSAFQTYTYFVIYPLIIFACLYCLFGIIGYGDFGLFNIAMIAIFAFCLIVATECLLKLRRIEVTEKYILVKTIRKDKVVNFKDVAFVYSLISYRGTYMVLWYKDTETQKLEVVLVRPEMEKAIFNDLDGGEDLPITKFIREKAIKENVEYVKYGKRRWLFFSLSPYLWNF
jgi:hypothetical protein